MKKDNFEEFIETCISERINHFGEDEPPEIQEAAEDYQKSASLLLQTLNKDQTGLWNNIESAQSLLDGEIMKFYYKSGFTDAIRFILKMRGNENNELNF